MDKTPMNLTSAFVLLAVAGTLAAVFFFFCLYRLIGIVYNEQRRVRALEVDRNIAVANIAKLDMLQGLSEERIDDLGKSINKHDTRLDLVEGGLAHFEEKTGVAPAAKAAAEKVEDWEIRNQAKRSKILMYEISRLQALSKK
jgi:hypothetical protein